MNSEIWDILSKKVARTGSQKKWLAQNVCSSVIENPRFTKMDAGAGGTTWVVRSLA